jgi:hypothetical protein
MEVPTRVDVNRIPVGQTCERRRQIGFRRHRGAIDQDWDHRYVPLESGFDLDPENIVWVIDPPVSFGRSSPPGSHHDKDQVALADRRADVFPEVDTERNVIDIHENVGTEARAHTIVDPPRNADRILAPV